MEHKEAEIQKLFNKLVSEGKLLSLFNNILEFIKDDAHDKEANDMVMNSMVDHLKIACNESLKCFHCGRSYNFRYCNNTLLEDQKAAIELSCISCNDIFIFNEGSKRISYFNLNVLTKIDNYKRWGRDISIKSTYGKLNWPAVLEITNNDCILFIELFLVEKSQDVEYYWKKSKKLITNKKNHYLRSTTLENGNKLYYL